MDETKGLILATVIIAAATTFVRQVSQSRLQFRAYLGASFMGIFLAGIGMVNARLARNFCILIILSVLLKDGGNVFTFAAKASKPTGGAATPFVGSGSFDYGAGGAWATAPADNRAPVVAPPPYVPPGASL